MTSEVIRIRLLGRSHASGLRPFVLQGGETVRESHVQTMVKPALPAMQPAMQAFVVGGGPSTITFNRIHSYFLLTLIARLWKTNTRAQSPRQSTHTLLSCLIFNTTKIVQTVDPITARVTEAMKPFHAVPNAKSA